MVNEIILYVGSGRSRLQIQVHEDWEQGKDRDEYIPEANWDVHIPGEWYKTGEHICLYTKDRQLQSKVAELLNSPFNWSCAEVYLPLPEVVALLLAGL